MLKHLACLPAQQPAGLRGDTATLERASWEPFGSPQDPCTPPASCRCCRGTRATGHPHAASTTRSTCATTFPCALVHAPHQGPLHQAWPACPGPGLPWRCPSPSWPTSPSISTSASTNRQGREPSRPSFNRIQWTPRAAQHPEGPIELQHNGEQGSSP